MLVACRKYPSMSTSSDMATVFHANPNSRLIELKRNFLEINFLESIRDPVFLEAVLAVKTMRELQSNSEKKDNPSILKDYGRTYQFSYQ